MECSSEMLEILPDFWKTEKCTVFFFKLRKYSGKCTCMSTCTYLEVVSIYLGKYVSCSVYVVVI